MVLEARGSELTPSMIRVFEITNLKLQKVSNLSIYET